MIIKSFTSHALAVDYLIKDKFYGDRDNRYVQNNYIAGVCYVRYAWIKHKVDHVEVHMQQLGRFVRDFG